MPDHDDELDNPAYRTARRADIGPELAAELAVRQEEAAGRPRIRPGQASPAWVTRETWKPIPAYRLLGIPAGYEASSEGRVRSPRQVLTQRPDGDGYPTVKLGGKPRRVAILVQLAWAGAPHVCHLDDDRSNSKPENLVWRSKVENEQMKREKGKEIRDGMECVPPFPPRTPGTAELH